MNKVIKDATDAWYRTASAATSFIELDYINEIVRPDEQVIVKVRFYTPASKQWSNTIYEYFIKPNIKMICIDFDMATLFDKSVLFNIPMVKIINIKVIIK